MDLGFGGSNQAVGDVAARAILAATTAQENALSDEIARYDALLESSDSDLERLRERRLEQMKRDAERRSKWRDLGHGSYDELGGGQHGGDLAKAFFDAAKKSERLVVHFHRPTTRLCDVFHSHLAKLAPLHVETRFVKIDVENCDASGGGGGASYLVEKLGIVVMPTLLVVKDRKAVHQIRGFDEVGGTEHFATNALARALAGHGALTLRDDEDGTGDDDDDTPLTSARSRGGVNAVRIQGLSARGRQTVRDSGYDFDEE